MKHYFKFLAVVAFIGLLLVNIFGIIAMARNIDFDNFIIIYSLITFFGWAILYYLADIRDKVK